MIRIEATIRTDRRQGGYTAVEMLMVVGVVMALMGLLIPVVGMIRESSRRAHAQALLTDIHMALRLYADEDSQRRFPPPDSDGFLRYDVGATPRTINRLMAVGLKEGIQTLVPDPADARARVLVDPWLRPYRYAVDKNMDGVPNRPAPKDDWNARALEPFAYVWSLGRPKLGHRGDWAGDPDALPRNSDHWLYVKNTAAVQDTP
jgi:type II secretory pathway pseudopilin PulG